MDARWPFVPRAVELWRVKEEPEPDACAAGGVSGVSEAAARAGLYAGHHVKDKLVLGPHTVQERPPDDTHAAPRPMVEVKQEPPCEVGGEHKLRKCCMALVRIPITTLVTSNTQGTEAQDGLAIPVAAAGEERENRDTTVGNGGGDDGAPQPMLEVKREPTCEVGGEQELRECRMVLQHIPVATLVTSNTGGAEESVGRPAPVDVADEEQEHRDMTIRNVGEDNGAPEPMVEVKQKPPCEVDGEHDLRECYVLLTHIPVAALVTSDTPSAEESNGRRAPVDLADEEQEHKDMTIRNVAENNGDGADKAFGEADRCDEATAELDKLNVALD